MTETWYGYDRTENLGEPDTFEVVRMTKTFLFGPNGQRDKKRSKIRLWWPSRREAILWAIERSNLSIIAARHELDEAARERRTLRQLLKDD